MTEPMPPAIDAEMLAGAFPTDCRSLAMRAGKDVARRLNHEWPTELFAVRVDGQIIAIPERLYFASERSGLPLNDEAWLFARALQTRSSDGFERQRALRDILGDLRPWGAPFVTDLIGQYVIEILEEILGAMTPELARTIAAFAAENPIYWAKTRQRVASYWNAYHRRPGSNDRRKAYRRSEYVGFALIDRIERDNIGAS